MNRQPFFTIITVTYNAQNSLVETIKSVSNQTFRDFEYIIIDGGSTDETPQIISSNKDDVSSWISEKDNGLYDAMNKGIKSAKGRYIYFLNAGDKFTNRNVLNEVRKALEIKGSPLLYGTILAARKDNKGLIQISRKVSPISLKLGRKLIHQSIFIKTQLLAAANGFDLKYKLCADYDLLCRLAVSNTIMDHIPLQIAIFDLEGLSSNIKETYRENLKIIRQNFGLFWAIIYKFTSSLKYFVQRILPQSRIDSLRRFDI